MLCVIISRRSSKRSRLHLLKDSVHVYERAGNNSFKQRFCTHSISFDSFFVKPGLHYIFNVAQVTNNFRDHDGDRKP